MDNLKPATETEKNNLNFIWPIKRIYKDRFDTLYDPVVLEEPLEIVVNGESLAVLMRLPGQEKELAMGFCLSEGYVRQAKDVLHIHQFEKGHSQPTILERKKSLESLNRIELTVAGEGLCQDEIPNVTRLIRSGCGAAEVSSMSEALPKLPQGLFADTAIVLGLGKAMRDLQTLHSKVGGTHSAALFTTLGEAVIQSEDIGRHNAVDKVVGYCLLRQIPLEDKILVTSGRASYEMVTKALRLGICVTATISAPTSLAVQIAEENGLTLIGYLRGERMNVYTHPERFQSL